jgi:hypothetical protein
MLKWLKGKKTYLIATAGIAAALFGVPEPIAGALQNGDWQTAVELGALIALRAGLNKTR